MNDEQQRRYLDIMWFNWTQVNNDDDIIVVTTSSSGDDNKESFLIYFFYRKLHFVFIS
jgi:hypothetical protein